MLISNELSNYYYFKMVRNIYICWGRQLFKMILLRFSSRQSRDHDFPLFSVCRFLMNSSRLEFLKNVRIYTVFCAKSTSFDFISHQKRCLTLVFDKTQGNLVEQPQNNSWVWVRWFRVLRSWKSFVFNERWMRIRLFNRCLQSQRDNTSSRKPKISF